TPARRDRPSKRTSQGEKILAGLVHSSRSPAKIFYPSRSNGQGLGAELRWPGGGPVASGARRSGRRKPPPWSLNNSAEMPQAYTRNVGYRRFSVSFSTLFNHSATCSLAWSTQ